MLTAGIIAEYNPFHNGHRYHIEKTKELTGADCVIAVMSGNFVQRGEPSVYSKHARAKAAVLSGADIVFELPAYFSLQSAQGFASGGVCILNALGADIISFGAECDNMDKLKKAGEFLQKESPAFKAELHSNLKKGQSFAAAKTNAVNALMPELGDLLTHPNNLLACEYLSAIKAQHSACAPVLIKREFTRHDSADTDGIYASASFLRTELAHGRNISRYSAALPDEKPLFLKDFEKLLLYTASVITKEELSKIPDTGDGIAERILSCDLSSLDNMLSSVKAKRFAMSRVKRVMMNILIKNNLPRKLTPSYLRVLALNRRGAEFLHEKKNSLPLPLIIKPASYKENDAIWQLEQRAANVRSVISSSQTRDVALSPVMIK